MKNYRGQKKKKILIVDDSQMNRMILMDILEDEFEILEAQNGEAAIKLLKKYNVEIALVLLDIVMPVMDGFEVLAIMNKYHWIDDVPVVMISAENSSTYIKRAYDLGVTDFISRPFDSVIVYRRVNNTIKLYTKQRKLVNMVTEQMYEKEKRNSLMVAILSHIVEFRNGESGLHVLHVQTITELLLKRLVQKTQKYELSNADISLISVSSALHDIGKIAIDEKILNKPGRLTKEEFEIMKTHSSIGASMLEELPFYQDEKLITIATQICHWHHERYDGRGYPDGLKGEEIPISAQVVALADVYDALTSQRVYKDAYSHDKSLEMIFNGECGTFNPLLLECLKDIGDVLVDELKVSSLSHDTANKMYDIVDQIHEYSELSTSERTIELLEYERKKNEFFATLSHEIQFEYTKNPPMFTLSKWSAEYLGLDENILNPTEDERIINVIGKENIERLQEKLSHVTIDDSDIILDCEINIKHKKYNATVVIRTMWYSNDKSQYQKFFGKITNLETE